LSIDDDRAKVAADACLVFAALRPAAIIGLGEGRARKVARGLSRGLARGGLLPPLLLPLLLLLPPKVFEW
jgi:hypothetical protein